MGKTQEDFLGSWAVLDIETTGIDAQEDAIIDVGFLQFQGTQLVQTYSSLVHYPYELSQYVQKLTGIHSQDLRHAPPWSTVRQKLHELQDHVLLAHNAEFEEAFLAGEFRRPETLWSAEGGGTRFADSLPFLGLLFPHKSQLNLESFIQEFHLREREAHRGYEDALDLLRVLLLGLYMIEGRPRQKMHLKRLFQQYQLEDSWYVKLFHLGPETWSEIGRQIDFDGERALAFWQSRGMNQEENSDDLVDETAPAIGADVKKIPREFSGKNIQQILQDEETVRAKLPFYKFRRSQEALALRAGQAFKNGVYALIQAPTGTGKTLGYLLPSALFALEEGHQVLVATGTKALQNQAMTQDIPQLRTLLNLTPQELRVARLVGSGNHLCELQFRKLTEEDDLPFQGSLNGEDERLAKAFLDNVFWHNSEILASKAKREEGGKEAKLRRPVDPAEEFHPQNRALTRDDLPYVLKKKSKSFARLEKEVAVDFRTCVSNRCPFIAGCGYIQDLRKAKEAHLIVGNHALMFSWPKGFPRPEYVIVDEAHRIEQEATAIFTLSLSQEQLQILLKSLEHLTGLGALFYLLSQEEDPAHQESIPRLRESVRTWSELLRQNLQDLPTLIETFFKR